MGTPAGQAGQRGAAPRGTGKAPTTRRVRSTPPRSRPGPGGNHLAGANLRRSKPDHLPKAETPPALTSLARLGTGHPKNFPQYPRDTEGKNRSACIPRRLCRVTKVGAFGGYRIVQTACSHGCLQLKGVFDLFCFGIADDIITEPQIIAVA